MRSSSDHMEAARKALADHLGTLPLNGGQRLAMSKLIARFTAAAVREDRVHRNTTDALAKLADVFFNGRRA